MTEPLLVARSGSILELTLNRPKVRNAIDRSLAEAIAAALGTLEDDPALRVGVLSGTGASFCSGMDLKAFDRGEVPNVEGRGFAGIVERPPAKPLIAAVEGHAIAGGFEIALACDLIVASREAQFGLPEVRRGLIAAGGGLFRLPRRIPYNEAARLALTGDLLPAPRAAELGLLADLVEPGETRAAAVGLAGRIAASAPLALAGSKVAMALSVLPEEEAWRAQAPVSERVAASEDAREGARAFIEKRQPVWLSR